MITMAVELERSSGRRLHNCRVLEFSKYIWTKALNLGDHSNLAV